MALALSKTPVRRGRADDGFSEAGSDTLKIVMEPAPSSRDMVLTTETIVGQGRMDARLMSKQVFVTLDAPYKGDPKATVVLTYGREEATAVGADRYQDDGAGSQPVPASERLFTQGAEFAAPLWEPGKWIHYHLRFEEGPLGKCSCGQDPETIVGREAVMPGPVARHYFGDWDVVSYELRARPGQQMPDWLTRSFHRDRVASECWGGYEMDFPVGVPVYDQRGAVNVRALRKFAPPAIPRVTISRLDTMMRRLPNTEANIWEIFDWQGVCEKGPRMNFFANKLEDTGLKMVSEDDFERRVAQAVAAAMAARDAAPKGKNA